MGFYHSIVVAEPNLAKFLLNLPPDITRKSGITSETFESDTNGFKEGLIMGWVLKSEQNNSYYIGFEARRFLTLIDLLKKIDHVVK